MIVGSLSLLSKSDCYAYSATAATIPIGINFCSVLFMLTDLVEISVDSKKLVSVGVAAVVVAVEELFASLVVCLQLPQC